MKTVARMSLKAGMVLGEDVCDLKGNLIFPEDTKLDDNKIKMLNRYNIMCVDIKEEVDFASTQYEKLRYNDKFKKFSELHQQSLLTFKALMISFLQTGQPVKKELLLEIYNRLFELAPKGAILLDYLYTMMPNEDELTYTHSLNSALLAGAFSDWFGLDEEKRETLILCGFYYDIGKLVLPYDVLWKPDKLSEEEFNIIKTHPIRGYQIVKNVSLAPGIKKSILTHHERMDGSGYPYKLVEAEIDIYARYMAIIDVYIAMASPRTYRNSKTPLEILGTFEQAKEKYDAEILIPIMKTIADTQIGSKVQLDDDSIWEVLIINANALSRPILKNDDSEILNLIDFPDKNIIKKM